MKPLPVLLVMYLLLSVLASACAPAKPDCASEQIFCIGLVTDTGKINDRSFNQAAWEAVQQAKNELGALVEYIESADARDYEKNISTFAEENYDVVVTVGSGLREATREVAGNYPDSKFIGVDQDQFEGTLDNVAGLVFREDQAGFLAGALAALMSNTHQIGAVCGPDAVPAVWQLGEGYKAGAAHVDEVSGTITDVFVIYHDEFNLETAFNDPEWGAETARSVLDQGADIIFGCGGQTGDSALITAAQSGVYTIGSETDQYWTLPEAAPYMLSSGIKRVTPGVFALITLAKDGAFPAGSYSGDVTYAPFHDLENEIPSEVRVMLEEIQAGLLDGSIRTNVPSVKP